MLKALPCLAFYLSGGEKMSDEIITIKILQESGEGYKTKCIDCSNMSIEQLLQLREEFSGTDAVSYIDTILLSRVATSKYIEECRSDNREYNRKRNITRKKKQGKRKFYGGKKC